MADSTSGKADSSSKKDDSGLGAVFSIIPAIYYDLIARICPGLAFWLAFFLGADKQLKTPDIATLLPVGTFILIVLSYIAGIALTGFSLIWDFICFVILRRLGRASVALGIEKGKSLAIQWALVAEKMEALAMKSDDLGRTVAKVLAEVALCQNLLSGFIVLLIVGSLSSGRFFFRPADHCLYFLIIGVSFFVAMLFRQAMFLGRVEALYQVHLATKA